MKHQVWLRKGPLDGHRVEVEDDVTEVNPRFARQGDPFALEKLGLPGGGERTGGVWLSAIYLDTGYRTPKPEAMRIFEFLEIEDP